MTRRALEALSALALVCPMTAVAQVGHPPQSSPYHDIHKGSSITFIGGYFMGDGGRAGVGPRDGYTFGARFDFHAARPLEFGLGVEYGALQRNIVDPTQPPGERVSGPVDQNVTFIEGLVTFNITGGKTWHGLAPFVSLIGGAAIGSSTPADRSGYNFGTKGFFAPTAGFRFFLGDRLHLRGEARGNFWKLSYPPSFGAGTVPVTLDASEWNLSPWFGFGLGFIL
jgi:hypothetical protein